MTQIPDAPWITETERRGTDYMYEFAYGKMYDEYDREPFAVYDPDLNSCNWDD